MEESGPLRGDEDGVSSPEVMAARVSLRIFFWSEGRLYVKFKGAFKKISCIL